MAIDSEQVTRQTVRVINIAEKLALFADRWSPKIVAECNNHEIRVVKLQGEFVWHHHEDADELFWVIRGNLLIHLRDQDLHLKPGEMVVIPRGVEHKPEAPEEVELVLIEPKGTLNTGNVESARTVRELSRI